MSIGDIIRVEKSILTDDECVSLSLHVGTKGEVASIGGDGDTKICFPELSGISRKVRCFMRYSFEHVSILQPLGSGLPLQSIPVKDMYG